MRYIIYLTACFLLLIPIEFAMSKTTNSYPPPGKEILSAIKGNVDVVKSVFSKQVGVNLDLDEESIKWIDGYINRNRERLDEETKNKLVEIFGSFLGEAIIKNFGGAWVVNDGEYGVHIKGDSFAFPFAKSYKQMHNRPEYSIYSFYTIIPMVLNGDLSDKAKY